MDKIFCILAVLLAVIFIVYTLKTKDRGKRYVIFCIVSALLLVTVVFLDKLFN
ncbi:hypothetical protein [Bacillus sp. MSP13]|uniref:hypothetical protein n=1 Tax=Bacillus sp. MSP13 TaxID=1071061 RepID=UPI000B0E1C66|nr:hypothetical protein [Bacillus sp. MSP13]